MKIIDDEEYEKNKAFTIELGEPVLLEIGQKHGESVSLTFVCLKLSFNMWSCEVVLKSYILAPAII